MSDPWLEAMEIINMITTTIFTYNIRGTLTSGTLIGFILAVGYIIHLMANKEP